MPSFPQRRPLLIGLITFLVVAVLGGIALTSDAVLGAKREVADQPKVIIDVKTAAAGAAYNPSAVGLSLEVSDATSPGLASGNFTTYLKTLGTGTIRFAGNSADESFWTTKAEKAPAWAKSTITPADLERIAKLYRESNWKIILGVNFKQFDPVRAADEVTHAHDVLGDSLTAIEVGNEPDAYYDDFNKYIDNYTNYLKVISAAVPKVRFYGGDFQGRHKFSQLLAQREAKFNNVSALTAHLYPQTNCEQKKATVAGMLASEVRTSQQNSAVGYAADAKLAKVLAIVDEANTVSCEGTKDVSDVFASALWSIDFSLLMQREGVSGVNFHGSISQCGGPRPQYKYYTPLCAPTSADAKALNLTAQPEFYGLLAARQIPAGKFVSVENPGWRHVLAYALKSADSTTLVLIDIDDPTKLGATPLSLDLDVAFKHAEATTLKTSAPKALHAKSGITIGRQAMAADGTFAKPVTTQVPVINNSVQLTVQPATATLITLR